MFIPERTHVHVVSPSRFAWALQATEQQISRRAMANGFDLRGAGAASDQHLNRDHAAVLVASVKAWRVSGSFSRIRAVSWLDPGLAPVRCLLEKLEESQTQSTVRNEACGGLDGFLGVAGPPLVPAAAVAISLFSGPSGRRRLSSGQGWRRLLARAQRKEVAVNDELWGDWEAFAAALRSAWRQNRGIAVEGRAEMYVCYRDENGGMA